MSLSLLLFNFYIDNVKEKFGTEFDLVSFLFVKFCIHLANLFGFGNQVKS